MRKIILMACMVAGAATTTFAQKYMTRTGRISFDATAPNSPEKIDAVNNEAATILDGATGGVVFQAPVKSFKFQRALMQEHFNENYMESDKYPKAVFNGTISDMTEIKAGKDGKYNVKVTGKLTIHGITNEVAVPGSVTIKGGALTLNAVFSVALQDYKISIPAVVADKVGKEARITIESSLTKK
jgi:polyisoprenoid-binding protein YceI